MVLRASPPSWDRQIVALIFMEQPSVLGHWTDRHTASARGLVPLAGNPSANGIDARMDEKEARRQRRKQSNRESARRSRLRKQAECDELGNRVHELNMENMALRRELSVLAEENKKLTSEHLALMEELRKYRPDDKREEDEGTIPPDNTKMAAGGDTKKAEDSRDESSNNE
ncbi:unnamed protein product [Calypogeia fissa]